MKNWRKAGIIILTLAFAVVFAACGGQNQTPPQTGNTEPSGSGGGEQKQEVFKLKTSIHAPEAIPMAKAYTAFLDEIEAKSEGRIEFERHYGGALAKAADEFRAISNGIYDLGLFIPSYSPSLTGLANITTNPMLWSDSWAGHKAYNELYQTIPEMQQELEKNNVKFVSQWMLTPYYLFTKKPIQNLEEAKGMTIVTSGNVAILIEQLGMTPLSIPITESYEAVERGIADGLVYGVNEVVSYGIHESAKYMYQLPFSSNGGPYAMNLNTWNKLPSDLQQLFLDTGANFHPDSFHDIFVVQGQEENLMKIMEVGGQITEPTQEDLDRVRQISQDVIWKKWIEDQTNAGQPAQQIFDTFLELIDKYEQERGIQ